MLLAVLQGFAQVGSGLVGPFGPGAEVPQRAERAGDLLYPPSVPALRDDALEGLAAHLEAESHLRLAERDAGVGLDSPRAATLGDRDGGAGELELPRAVVPSRALPGR